LSHGMAVPVVDASAAHGAAIRASASPMCRGARELRHDSLKAAIESIFIDKNAFRSC